MGERTAEWNDAWQAGYDEGRAEGRDQGYEEGWTDGAGETRREYEERIETLQATLERICDLARMHAVRVTPCFNAPTITVSGRNRNAIKDYITDVLAAAH